MNYKKLEKFDASYFRGKNYFDDEGTQNYLASQPIYKYLKTTGVISNVSSWEPKGLSNERIKSFTV